MKSQTSNPLPSARNLSVWRLLLLLVPAVFAAKLTAQSIPTDNVVVYYPFNGTPADASGNNKSGNAVNTTYVADRLGAAGKALHFNGSSSYMIIPDNFLPNSNAFAISCWIKPVGTHATSEQWQTIIDLRNQYQISMSYWQPDYTVLPNAVSYNTYSAPSNITIASAANAVMPDTWSHIVASYNNKTMELYVNGTLVASAPQTVPNPVNFGYNNAIGKDYKVGMNRGWFNGDIDDVIVYSQSLTAAEAKALYNRGLATSDIAELFKYPPVKYKYDDAGRLTDRKTIVLPQNTLRAALKDSTADPLPGGDVYSQELDGATVLIYPNPTKGQLKVDIYNLAESKQAHIYLYNLQGIQLLKREPANTSNELDLTPFNTGTYIMRVAVGDKAREWKIVKE